MKKNIIVFSNPFGYGPTGVAIPIIVSLLEKVRDIEVTFVGSGLCMEIVSNVPVKKVILDERNETEIEDFLKTVKDPLVISAQNKFCIKVSKKMNIPCAYVDILAWFWRGIPQDHLLADEIFWMKFPNIEKKIPKGQGNIHLISSVITTLPPRAEKGNNLIIHIGGAKYPVVDGLSYSYLNLISKGLNVLPDKYESVIFAAGLDAIDYLKQKVTNKKILFASFSKDELISRINNSCHILTTAGVSSTLESFSLDVPVSFLLPMNLSHFALLDLLREQKIDFNSMDWFKYTKINDDIRDMSEKEAIFEINKYSNIVDGNDIESNNFVRDFIELVETVPDNLSQKSLIKQMGENGASEIVDILAGKWELV